jgi:sirohydrochlorin ferrochelatase
MAKARRLIYLTLMVVLLSGFLYAPSLAAPQEKIGIIILGHGDPTPEWAEEIIQLAERANLDYPTEVAFLEMVPQHTLEGAMERLAEKNVGTIVVVPLLISSHHSHGREIEYLLGLKKGISSNIIKPIPTDARIILTPGMNGHPLIGELLLERALSLSCSPSQEIVVFLIHGSELKVDWNEFQKDMDCWCDFVRGKGGFKDVRYGILTPNFNIPQVVRKAKREGDVIAIPLVLSEGMYSEMLFPMLIGEARPPLTAVVDLCSGFISSPMSLCLSSIPETFGDPTLMLAMEVSDRMMGMMMGGGGNMGGMMQTFSQFLLCDLEYPRMRYTTEGLVPHPKVAEWLKESVEESLR